MNECSISGVLKQVVEVKVIKIYESEFYPMFSITEGYHHHMVELTADELDKVNTTMAAFHEVQDMILVKINDFDGYES